MQMLKHLIRARTIWIGAGLALALGLCWVVATPFFLQITDQAGPFVLTFSAGDIDQDGDPDVLVHNLRHPNTYEAYAGGTLWRNQGGQLSYRRSDLEGGWASTLGDLDGDGDPDLLVYAPMGEHLDLGINQGGDQGGEAGRFRLVAAIDPPEREVGQYGLLLTGDLNGDGRLDALVLGRAHSYPLSNQDLPPNHSWIWMNPGLDMPSMKADVAALADLEGLSVGGAALGDLDGDGDVDLLAAVSPSVQNSMSGAQLRLLLNDGAGGLRDSGQRLDAAGSSGVALGDLDGDGDLDALVGTQDGGRLLVNQGGAQGGAPGKLAAGAGLDGSSARSVWLGDVDGDGDLDALLSAGRSAWVWLNDGQGNLARAGQRIACAENQDITLLDLDGDGDLDLFQATYDHTARVWWNDGAGRFQAGAPNQVGEPSQAISHSEAVSHSVAGAPGN